MKTQSSYLNLFLSILILTMFGCNQTNKENVNLLLKPWDGPFEGVPAFDKVKVEDVEEAMLTAMELHLEEIQTIANNTASPSFENTIEAMELSGNDLQKAYAYYGVLSRNQSTPEFRTEAYRLFRGRVAKIDALMRARGFAKND